jgi:hypothetical protein
MAMTSMAGAAKKLDLRIGDQVEIELSMPVEKCPGCAG